jgi:hypothetical protein
MMLAPTAPPPLKELDKENNEIMREEMTILIGGRGRVQMMLAPTAPLPQKKHEGKKMY